MSNILLSPNPGYLPTKPAPRIGERILLEVAGLPPYKDPKFSIRNPHHRIHDRFVALREAATREMNGRKWSDGCISISLAILAPQMEKARCLIDYVGGVMDTLDGSHGCYFTYLPIVYQDDSQVSLCHLQFVENTETKYTLDIEFVEKPATSKDNQASWLSVSKSFPAGFASAK